MKLGKDKGGGGQRPFQYFRGMSQRAGRTDTGNIKGKVGATVCGIPRKSALTNQKHWLDQR